MRSNYLKAKTKTAVLAVTILLLAIGTSFAQSVNLTAAPASAVLPDGQSVPMWGYSCGAVVAPATCAAANPKAGTGWSPVVITVPAGPLTINLTNSLPTPPGASAGIPTSLVIVGQLGGGLGGTPTRTPSPAHATQVPTWPIAGDPTDPSTPTFTPPTQNDRVQSFGTEVAAGTTTALGWTALNPGTYLIESGTHPSIQGPMGLYGVLVVTTAPSGGTAGTAYPGVSYNADVPLVLSEIDPVQNAAVNVAVGTSGFTETAVWSGQPNGCGNPTSATYHTCYPPAVNYDPRYYLVNGVSLDRTAANLSNSLFATNPATATGTVLVRFVNAGLRMHVPSIVGSTTGAALTPGFSLIAEDGNPLPGTPRVQSEVFLAAGKTYDVMINAPASGAPALPVFDRQLSLSTNNQRDGGMQAYIGVNAGVLPSAGVTAQANPDAYTLVNGTVTVSDPSKGLLANDVGIYGAAVSGTVAGLSLNADGTFTYTGADATFTYCGNGTTTLCTTVTLASCSGTCVGGAPTANNDAYTSNLASRLQIAPPGVLANDTDPQGHPLTAALSGAASGGTVVLNADGSFTATPTTPPTGTTPATVTFQYIATNSQKTASGTATVTVTFNGGSGLKVNVYDAPSFSAGSPTPITDYRWIIEEDRTFNIVPNPTTSNQNFGTNFHTSYMPVVASGCVGVVACESGQTVLDPVSNTHKAAVCDIGNGTCRTDAGQQVAVDPGQVHLDPAKRYYLTIFPGDAGNSFSAGAGAPVPVDPNNPNGPQRQFSIAQDCGSFSVAGNAANWAPGSGTCGHGMGGAPIAAGQTTVNVTLEETPFPTANIAVFVFEDDSPLNGENDVHGGTDTAGTSKEPGLGGFEITLFDDAGGTGDATGQMTYDMFNMPLSNALTGTIDALTGLNACPITSTTDGLIGMIVTCPTYESDGVTVSPLVGQAVIANMMPGRYGVVANPGADRFARGEEWLQTNTLDGQKAHDSFMKIGGPAYFQEFGPAGYHVSVGFANPAIINARLAPLCTALAGQTPPQACNNTVTGLVTNMHQSRTPDQRLYSSGTRDSLGFTQCYVSLGDPDDDDIAFTKCASDGTFTLSGLPDGDWRITLFDQWNDQIVDGLSTPVRLSGGKTVNMEIPVQQWHTNIYTSSFFDLNGNGVRDNNEPGLTLLPTNIRFRDGSYSNFNNTDLNGNAGFNEIFPLFNWYVIETDVARYKQTGVHVVYDAGGPVDGNGGGTSTIAANFANTKETNALPTNLRFPGAVYCGNADCTGFSIQGGPASSAAPTATSTGRIDPPWVTSEAWQGFIGENEFIEFGKAPFAAANGALPAENGGIHGEVIYASTRPFDDPGLLIHTSWTPDVPGVTINLYQEGTAADGTQTLTLIDTTKTSSWDDWAQGFRTDGVPNMNCPGQDPTSPFFFTLMNSTEWLNPTRALPNNSQFKCYDGLSMFNQVQPAPYDGMYQFPSVVSRNPVSGAPTTACKAGSLKTATAAAVPGCIANPVDGTPMLQSAKYVVEMIVPPGYELVKEEDKNILIGDNYIAPVTQQFGGLGNIFILPDQAAVGTTYNANSSQNPTQDMGRNTLPNSEGDTGSVEVFWPCVGASRVVPDYISLFPQSKEVAPFAGATRRLCDRKEVTLDDQASVLAKFWVFSSTHVAAHFTGIMLDDLSSEFDPFSPQFGEKFAIPNAPISFKDHNGIEISRTYSDQWGLFNGLNYSTWEVNPPNPTGYAPTMMVTCMNDPGPIHTNPLDLTSPLITDPLYNPSYSQFCYEIPFMPGQTQYMDTPIVPTAAFAEGYNLPDCSYPDGTPAIASVLGDTSGGGAGPWVSAAGHTLTINSLGIQPVLNNAYSGPSSTTAPFNQKFINRNYSFSATQGTGSVTIGGVNAPVTSWSATQIKVTVPTLSSSQSSCTIQQRGVSATTRCGQLVITSNGKQSIDTVTVTVGGKAPTYVNGENSSNNAIQNALDKATPGDLIIVGPGNYNEMLLMWKPVRLQGVGAASVSVNANTHPSGRMDAWRRKVDCLFDLALDGGPISKTHPYDPTGANSCAFVDSATGLSVPQVDPIPLEPITGWDPTLNGNIAELLQEPTLMGAYEGAAITVLGKGVRDVTVRTRVNGRNVSDLQYDPNCIANGICTTLTGNGSDCSNYPSNFMCNPSRIDGISFQNSSQGGGGIFLHGYNHYTEVSNNRVHSNAGTLSGGITVGQAETPDGTIAGTQEIPFAFDINVNVHHNSVTQNAAFGDELNSTTPMSAGGVTFCTGSDNYKFSYNWVCGNLSTGDGGGVSHYGLSYNGNISNNQILFNQSNNITIPTNGGGLTVMGAPPDGPVCENSTIDVDCPPSLSDGAGPGLVIDSNLILGNTAESGSGGGIRLQSINGTEVARNPKNPGAWYGVTLTNNIITNNVAGWDGGGISLQDALRVSLINNTIASNDTTASSGVLFNTLGAADANTPPPTNGGGNCDPTVDLNCTGNQIVTSTPQPAGLVTTQNTPNLVQSLPAGGITCPAGQPSCAKYSNPLLENNLFWQNRAFNIQVGGVGAGVLNQQNLVALVPQLNQASTGACPTASNYWDIGVRGDTGPANHSSGLTLHPTFSILTDAGDYPGANNQLGTATTLIKQYCNGAKVPPENGGMGYIVPPGISDATAPNPLFNLTPAATVDEGNNWINMAFGPLSLSNFSGVTLGNYSINAGTPAVNNGSATGAPNHDFFGNPRPQGGGFDIGAVEIAGGTGGGGSGTVSITPNPLRITVATPIGNFGSGTGVVTLRNTSPAGGASVNITNVAVTSGAGSSLATWFFNKEPGAANDTCTGATLAPNATCTVTVRFTNVTSAVGVDRPGTITFTDSATGSPQSGALVGHANP